MKFIVKKWNSESGKLCTALFYETKNGRFLITFDKWVIIALLGSYSAYRNLDIGEYEYTAQYIVQREEK